MRETVFSEPDKKGSDKKADGVRNGTIRFPVYEEQIMNPERT